MTTKPQTIDEYLAPLPEEKRASLERLRQQIHAAAPEAEECISYGIPAFRLHGRLLVAFGAAVRHCAFYPGAHPIAALADELDDYDTSKGTVRYTEANPLSPALVRRLVQARIDEHDSQRKSVSSRPAAHKATAKVAGTGTPEPQP